MLRFFENTIATRLESEIATLGNSATDQVQSALDSIPESMSGFLSLLGMDTQALTDNLSQQISASGGNVLDALMVNVITPVMTVILKIILFVVVFILAVLILKLFTVLIEKFAKLPVIKQANGIFGGVFGAVKGVVVAAVLCFAITLIAGFVDNSAFLTAVDDSKIVNIFNVLIKDMNIINV